MTTRWAGNAGQCNHVELAREQTVSEPRCERCVAEGTHPVALRQCLICGTVGCCDSSPGKHATAHYQESGHMLMRSAEPDDTWGWCYIDERELTSTTED